MVAKRKADNGTEETFGQRLARLRKLCGLTQIELARRVGISQPNISAYERDSFRPNSDTLLKIVDVLKVPADDVLGTRKNSQHLPVISRKLLRRLVQIEKLSRHDQRSLLRTIDKFLTVQ